ncbi:MAG TPA: Gfo/Idh/MocA family oxidoreductase [Bryobacteraceae bacterium]|nr:Gfo/Idh/MocA family oxidoreductase [Bryobacteraceae bacterium]
MNRRNFLAASSAVALASGAVSANDKVNLAVIGIRGQGRHLAGGFAGLPDVNIVHLCDVDDRVYANCAKVVQERSGRPAAKLVKDLRRVLDDKGVDAVAIATPDHWHAPATILACAAGKDVYVEKPPAHNVREGHAMVKAARQHQRIVTVGTHSRSRPSTLRAMEYVQSGKIGKILMAKAWDVQLRDYIGHKEDSPVPPEVDFDTWTGPAVFRPFNENRFHYKWHWQWNTGTGDIGNDGAHQIDMARWALGVGNPTNVYGSGRKIFFDDDQQTPDTMNISYDYPDRQLIWEMRIWNPYGMEGQQNGVAVYGTDGSVQIGRWPRPWGYRVYDAKGKLVSEEYDPAGDADSVHHHRNFIECVKSRKKPNADIEELQITNNLLQLGNIVSRTGRNVKFDGATETIAGDSQANAMLGREYRKHWSTPKV